MALMVTMRTMVKMGNLLVCSKPRKHRAQIANLAGCLWRLGYANADGVLDADESATSTYVCNGEDGGVGDDGQSIGVQQTEEAPGDNCDFGGALVETWVDANADGVLDADETATGIYLCNGADGGSGSAGADGHSVYWFVKPLKRLAQCPRRQGFD